MKSIFNLSEDEKHELMNIFEEAAIDGSIDRPSFEACFEHVLGNAPTEEAAQQMHQVLQNLFDIFDRDCDGVVDSLEFNAGLSVLGNTAADSSARRAFDAYDLDGNGYISLDEMICYLKSVFAVIAKQSPEVFKKHNVGPDELATATAKSCFAEADLNGDGCLSFDEFKQWYQSPSAESIKQFGEVSAAAEVSDSQILRNLQHCSNLIYLVVYTLFFVHFR